MEQKFVLVEYKGDLNFVISQTFKDLQRIKLVCFDVSNSFIVFGASSGGIYIFKRKPCQFLKLIPSKEGSARKISISSNEKYVAIASTKGLIVILEDLFIDTQNIDYQIYCEHEGNKITAMKWHNNDLFCGDDAGKVSVISLVTLLTKAIFQTPSTFLMTLDSSVVEIDVYTRYILVSTKTQTYICNLEKEQYKQVGKKIRDGDFGACFYRNPKDNNCFASGDASNIDDIRIYCARPGARLWEANLEGTVEVTYQFKGSLSQSHTELLQIKDDLEEDFQIVSFSTIRNVPDHFSFEKIFTICSRFVLTFNCDGIYIFDPISNQLAFWTNHFDNIKDMAFVNSLMYIWQDGWKISTISLLTLEELILKILYKKQYYLCTKICLHFLVDIQKLLENSDKLHLLSILKIKVKDEALLEKLVPIMQLIEGIDHLRVKKAKNGLVFIKNVFAEHFLPESVEDINKQSQAIIEQPQTTSIRYEIEILLKQFKLNKTHHVEIPETEKLLNSLTFGEIHMLFNDFIDFCQTKHGEDAVCWCQKQFLKQCTQRNIDISTLSSDCLQYLKESFLAVEKTECVLCSCGFPLPEAHKNIPKFSVIGQKLLNVTDSPEEILKTVPYLFKYKITSTSVNSNFPLLVQYSSLQVFDHFYKNLTYDSWDAIVSLTIKLKDGHCLNCDNKISTQNTLHWNELGIIIIKSIGPSNCTKLLKRYSSLIPKGVFESKFYQMCIFASVTSRDSIEVTNPAIDFLQGVTDQRSRSRFEHLLEKYLQKKYLGKSSGLVLTSKMPDGNCEFCDLPLSTPVLDDVTKGQCGHLFHSLCFSRNNYICKVCI